ncbi:MAG: hypothetical protein GX577_07430 [Leptolinea sp.]|nr:hypothetical protein [Leptolinea sp.]
MNTPFMDNGSKELDHFQEGDSFNLPEEEQWLAEELIHVARLNPPDSRFVNTLSLKLRQQHPANQAFKPASRRLWFTLAGSAVVILIALFGLPFLRQPGQTVTVVTDIPTIETTIVSSQPTEPINLPVLPMLGPSSVMASANLGEQFPDAQWTLQAELPSSPASAAVYKTKATGDLSIETVRQLVDQLGMKGEIYKGTSSQPDFQSFQVIDGKSFLNVYGHNMSFNYLPDVFKAKDDHGAPLKFETMSQKAVGFLSNKGLLNFNYTVEPGILFARQVHIIRLLEDNVPLRPAEPADPDFVVTVGSDGEVLEVRGRIIQLKKQGDYPLRTASDAWKTLLDGQLGGRFGYQIARLYTSPPDDRTWARQFEAGDRMELIDVPEVLTTVDGKQSVVRLNNYNLEGDFSGINLDDQQLMHVTGTLASDARVIVETIEPVSGEPGVETLGFTGILRKDNTGFAIQTMDGKLFPLSDAPEDLPDGEPVSIAGRLSEDGRVQWTSIFAGSSVCATFSSSFSYFNASAGGGGGGGGGGGEGDMCSAYPDLHGNVITGGFDNLQPGTPISAEPHIETPYKHGEKVEGIEGEITGILLVKTDGTRVPQFSLVVENKDTGNRWTAGLRGDTLSGLESHLRMMIRLWGTYGMEGGNPVIKVDRWERVDPTEKVSQWIGTIDAFQVDSKNAYVLTINDGTQFILKNSMNNPPEAFTHPPTSPDGQFYVEGVLLKEKIQGYPVIREIQFSGGQPDQTQEFQSTRLMEVGPLEGVSDLVSGQVNITGARLVYFSMDFGARIDDEDHPTRILQPLWEFSGTLEDGRKLSLFVQAVEEQYLK